ncbi:MAG: glycosyltransferase family 39 protein, partial [Patescibacteria group bacterium]
MSVRLQNLWRVRAQWLAPFFLVILAAIPRFIALENLPPDALNQDEAVDLYDAYSILRTGRDHRGNFLPLHLAAFSDVRDNRTPLFTYASVPAAALFGLRPLAVRVVSAATGVATVLLVYAIALRLFKDRRAALAAGVFLALSPWHIFLSRAGFEPITVPFFLALGTWFFLHALDGNRRAWYGAAIAFAVGMYAYAPVKVAIPLWMFFLLAAFRNEIRVHRLPIFRAAFLFLLMVAPFAVDHILHWEAVQGRYNEVSVFTYGKPWPLYFLANYASHFSAVFTNPRSLSLAEAIGFIFGIVALITARRESQMARRLLFGWLVIAPLPAAMTSISPHTLRSAAILPAFAIVEAIGFLFALRMARALPRRIVVPAFAALLFLIAARDANFYVSSGFPFTISTFHARGYQSMSAFLREHGAAYRRIVVITDREKYSYLQPYIFFLVYLQYDPKIFHDGPVQRIYDELGWQHVTSFGRF